MLTLLSCGQGQNGSLLLLDIYGSASAAYSLRKLRTAYTGSAIRVRRASDNTETNIGFVNNELDTATLASFCSGTNGFVNTWYDQSGNNRNLSQANALQQPKIYDIITGLILDNGKPAILGDRFTTLETNSFIVSQPSTKFIVNRNTSSFNNNVISSSLDSNARHQVTYTINNGGEYTIFAGVTLISAVKNLLNIRVLSFSLFNGNNSEIRINNSAATIGNAGNFSNNGMSLGAIGLANTGYIQEKIYYPSNKSSDRLAIETEINNYYNIY